MAAVVLTGPQAVELHIIERCQPFSPGRVFPYPVLERLLDKLLLALGDGGFFLVQNSDFLSVPVLNIVKNPHIPQVQGVLDDLVGIDAGGAVGAVGLDVHPVNTFPLHIPGPRVSGEMDVNFFLTISGRVQQFKNKLLHHVRGEPSGAEPHGNLTGV